jgi:N-acetyl-anhydromuramyl-L-alanine amidase AmpD
LTAGRIRRNAGQAALLACAGLLAACASGPRIDASHSASSQDSRVQFIVLHFTSTEFPESLTTLTRGDVSSHYLVRDKPATVFRLVDDNKRAWHAGASSWKGYTQLNAASIGIEIVNRGLHDGVWDEYAPEQVDAVIELVRNLAREYDVPPDRVLGHSDIAPQRKIDPGPKFPWKRLADAGLAAWPDEKRAAAKRALYEKRVPDAAWFQRQLARVGYEVPHHGELDAATRNVLTAFQMKYRPARFDGEPDAETAALLDALATSPEDEALDNELAAIVSDPSHPLASLSVLAIRNGQVAYIHQFGNRVFPSERTMFRAASISKLVVTLGVMRLVEQGKLSLDADVSGYLGYALRNPHFPDAPITLRMLLDHTSSLRDGAFYFWPAKHALKDVLLPGGALHGEGAMWAANAPPGAYFSYTNLNWGVVGTIMERVTGERFDRLMKRLILDPMGVRGGFNPADFTREEIADLATLYCKCREVDGKEAYDAAGPWIVQHDDYSVNPPAPRADASYPIGSNGTVFGPQGNLRISPADLGRIMAMLMNKGVHEGRRLLAPESVDAMFATQWRYDGTGGNGENTYGDQKALMNAWGLGTQVFLDIGGASSGDRLVERGGFAGVGHLGEAYALTGAFVMDPARKDGLIFFAGGVGFEPSTYPGKYSALRRYEEKILTALARRLGR